MSAATCRDLTGLSVMIVEDELLLSWELERLLSGRGATVLGPAPSVDVALALMEHHPVDFALVDVNLGGQWSEPVVRELQTRKVPCLLLTSYDVLRLEEPYRSAAYLPKPVDEPRLLETLLQMVAESEVDPEGRCSGAKSQ